MADEEKTDAGSESDKSDTVAPAESDKGEPPAKPAADASQENVPEKKTEADEKGMFAAVLRNYANLRADYTRKCQELSELRKTTSVRKTPADDAESEGDEGSSSGSFDVNALLSESVRAADWRGKSAKDLEAIVGKTMAKYLAPVYAEIKRTQDEQEIDETVKILPEGGLFTEELIAAKTGKISMPILARIIKKAIDIGGKGSLVAADEIEKEKGAAFVESPGTSSRSVAVPSDKGEKTVEEKEADAVLDLAKKSRLTL